MPVSVLTKKERFLLAARGGEVDRPPVWIMRQVGRYDPDYLDIRKSHSFRDLCMIPEVCASASILPLKTLDVDALIVFNDILIPLEAMGVTVDFPDSGPAITNSPRTDTALDWFQVARFADPPVAQCLRALRAAAGIDVPILGFAGAPFTLASYAVEGVMSRNQHVIKELMYGSPKLLHELLARIAETAANYLIAQIEAGTADAVQIFESQAPALAAPEYEEFAAAYQRVVIKKVKAACPDTPIILYARGSSAVLESMADAGADILGVDWHESLADARIRVPNLALQGNLDPGVLLCPDAVEPAVARMLEGFDWRRGYIANLGHGIIPQAKVSAAQRFVAAIQALGNGSSH